MVSLLTCWCSVNRAIEEGRIGSFGRLAGEVDTLEALAGRLRTLAALGFLPVLGPIVTRHGPRTGKRSLETNFVDFAHLVRDVRLLICFSF